MPSSDPQRLRSRLPLRHASLVAAVAIVYLLAGKLGLSLAFVHASATAVWPATGIALASLLIFGLRLWPAILIGAFIVNVTTSGSVLTSMGVAAGNTLEAVIGTWLAIRFANGVHAFDRASTLFRFVLVAGMLATTVSATIGVTVLALGGEAAWSRYGSIWLTWWLGDAVGACIVTPVLVLWAVEPRVSWTRARVLEAVLLLAAVVLVALLAFAGGLPRAHQRAPIEFLCVPVGIWAAFRFGAREAATATIILATIALWGTLQGLGPFAGGSEHRSIALLQAFIGVVGVMLLAVATLVSERKASEARIRRLNEALEERVRDRTARLEASNSELRRLVGEQAARREAEEANRMKDEFLATLSHELRTPLNAIIGWLQILGGRPIEPGLRQTLDVVERNATALRRLIDDILDVSAIVSGKLHLNVQPVDLRSVVQASVDSMRPLADAKRIRLDAAISAGDLPVLGDIQRLQQVVTNLIANALKFTSAGGEIRVDIMRADSQAVLRVADNGVGIRADVLPHVFEQFRQGDSSLTRSHGGLGLGLAIVRHLVELHRGTVRAESPGEGRGAVFTVEMPLIVANASSEAPGRLTFGAVTPGALTGLKVLVADDDTDTRELLVAGLSAAGAQVRSASSARGALHEIIRTVPDLLLLDIAMPGEDGYACLQAIRRHGITVAAVALTAHAGEHERQRAIAAGFIEFVAKPSSLPQLIALIERLCDVRPGL